MQSDTYEFTKTEWANLVKDWGYEEVPLRMTEVANINHNTWSGMKHHMKSITSGQVCKEITYVPENYVQVLQKRVLTDDFAHWTGLVYRNF